jgi:hypothetical protein
VTIPVAELADAARETLSRATQAASTCMPRHGRGLARDPPVLAHPRIEARQLTSRCGQEKRSKSPTAASTAAYTHRRYASR